MSPQWNDFESDSEPSLRWLCKSLARAIAGGLRRNKLAAALAGAVLIALLVYAVQNRFDPVADYQGLILPRLLRLETGFLNSLRAAENASGEWRAYYFKDAHSAVKDIIRAATLDRPRADAAETKHREFIRYYEFLDSEFHKIEMQRTTNPSLDYVTQLIARMEEAKPMRDSWAQWAMREKS